MSKFLKAARKHVKTNHEALYKRDGIADAFSDADYMQIDRPLSINKSNRFPINPPRPTVKLNRHERRQQARLNRRTNA